MRGQPLETFVDRVAELGLLEASLESAERGQPRVALIVGESGLGKTSLLRRLARVAEGRGAIVLHAACQEGLDIPYLPIATALQALDVQEASTGDRAPPPSLFESASETMQLALFVATTEALRRACQRATVVFVVDDAQWADAATTELMSHVAASLLLSGAGAPHSVLLVLAHRPSVDAGVARLLDRLRRHPAASEIPLRAFETAESNALVSAVAGAKPQPATLAWLLEESGGNPLLLRGLLDRNLADRNMVIDGSRLVLAGAGAAGVRRDLDVDAQDRIARLSEGCRAAVGLAAFIGGQGDIAVLSTALEAPAESALVEAEAAGILAVEGERYRFELDEVRRHLRDLAASRAAAVLHRRVAAALEAVHGDAAPASLMLAHVLGEEPRSPGRVRSWAQRAGDGAFSVGAWSDAVSAYSILFDDPGPVSDALETARLRLRAGVAAFWANDIDAARLHLAEATVGSRAVGDVETWAEAVLTRGRLAFVGGDAGSDAGTADLDEVLDATADRPTLHARALATAADLAYARFEFVRGIGLARAAVEVNERVEDPSALPYLSFGVQLLATLQLREAERLLMQAERTGSERGDHHIRTVAQSRSLLLDLVRGDLPKIEANAAGIVAEMHRRGFWPDVQVALSAQTSADLLAGRFADAEQAASITELIHDWVPYAFTAGMLFPAQAGARSLRGDRTGANRALSRWSELEGRGVWRYRQLVDVILGDVDDVRRQLDRRAWPSVPQQADLFSLGVLAAQVEIGAAVEDARMVEPALGPLEEALGHGVRFTTGWPVSLHRVLGIGARACDRLDEAIAWFELGLDELGQHAPVETARIQRELAEAELVTGVAGGARRAAVAAGLLDDLGMLPVAAAARRLGAGRSRRGWPAPRRRVVFCSDIVGSTELNIRAGDATYVDLLGEHDRILRELLRVHDGVEFKHTGDGILAWFPNADDAVRCAISFRDELERWSVTRPELPFVARIGLAEGNPVDTGDDLFGLTVVLASRLCGIAGNGRVLAADEVVAACTPDAFNFLSLGARSLKGFTEDVTVWEALRVLGD